VEHGGYYLVTDGLAAKYPRRVRDFPPDETSILGAAQGFSQCGLLPVVEIPYAKYLDCAADMFHEMIITHWLSSGSRDNKTNVKNNDKKDREIEGAGAGMVVRLQGFDKGIFGGNFHTHNVLSIPPGLDVVCFSNGADYVRGLRHAVRQARAGRVVMSVDSTDLLNRRHLTDAVRDNAWLTRYPSDIDDELSFADVIIYSLNFNGNNSSRESSSSSSSSASALPGMRFRMRSSTLTSE
jgi:pyruvate/2-oxoglutarate/acetoin dehydrogenase E1 component